MLFRSIFTSTKAKQSEKSEEYSREATKDELENESMSLNEMKLFEICGDSVIYHHHYANRIKAYTKREFKNFRWVIAECRFVIGGVIYHYELQNGYGGDILLCFFHKRKRREAFKDNFAIH